MIIIPIKWLFHWEYTQHFQTHPFWGSMLPFSVDSVTFERRSWLRHPDLRHAKASRHHGTATGLDGQWIRSNGVISLTLGNWMKLGCRKMSYIIYILEQELSQQWWQIFKSIMSVELPLDPRPDLTPFSFYRSYCLTSIFRHPMLSLYLHCINILLRESNRESHQNSSLEADWNVAGPIDQNLLLRSVRSVRFGKHWKNATLTDMDFAKNPRKLLLKGNCWKRP